MQLKIEHRPGTEKCKSLGRARHRESRWSCTWQLLQAPQDEGLQNTVQYLPCLQVLVLQTPLSTHLPQNAGSRELFLGDGQMLKPSQCCRWLASCAHAWTALTHTKDSQAGGSGKFWRKRCEKQYKLKYKLKHSSIPATFYLPDKA